MRRFLARRMSSEFPIAVRVPSSLRCERSRPETLRCLPLSKSLGVDFEQLSESQTVSAFCREQCGSVAAAPYL